MCEDMAHRRANLNSILELCESHHKASLLPPPNKVIKQLVEDVFQDSVSLKKHLYLKNFSVDQFIKLVAKEFTRSSFPGGSSCFN